MGFAVLDDVESYPVIRAKNKFGTDFQKNMTLIVTSLF